MGPRPLDVYRRQILTSKDYPRAVRVELRMWLVGVEYYATMQRQKVNAYL